MIHIPVTGVNLKRKAEDSVKPVKPKKRVKKTPVAVVPEFSSSSSEEEEEEIIPATQKKNPKPKPKSKSKETEQSFKCEFCSKSCSSLKALRKHIIQKHSESETDDDESSDEEEHSKRQIPKEKERSIIEHGKEVYLNMLQNKSSNYVKIFGWASSLKPEDTEKPQVVKKKNYTQYKREMVWTQHTYKYDIDVVENIAKSVSSRKYCVTDDMIAHIVLKQKSK